MNGGARKYFMVWNLSKQGKTAKQIAKELDLHPNTVRRYLRHPPGRAFNPNAKHHFTWGKKKGTIPIGTKLHLPEYALKLITD